MPSTLDSRAHTGFANSSTYDRGRPSYSPTIVQLLLERLQVNGRKGARIVDLAAGTGKFTEGLAAREEGFEIIAVEPHDDMREVLAAKRLPGVSVVAGLAEKLEAIEDESIDAVICAQSFHWFATLPALREIHRIIKPHGALGLVWNVDSFNAPQDEPPPTAWETKVGEILWSFDDDHPRYRHAKWRAVFDDQVESSPLALLKPKDQLFSLPLGEQTEDFEVKLSREQVWERFTTFSHIAVLEGAERERVHKTFMEAIDSDEHSCDNDSNVILHGHTRAVWTSKIPAEGRAKLLDVERPQS